MPQETEENNDLASFDFSAFAADLSSQAAAVVPPDISPEDKEFVVDIILRFCQMAGDALVKEENSKLNATEASLVTQFIGEWIFHKSIDIIRAGIEPQYREGILQRVAFTVFEIAKQAVEKDLPQEQLINLVEAHVKKCFEKAMADMKERGILSEEMAQNALSQSNIDAMAIAEVEDEMNQDIACMSDAKIIKLASLAILMRTFSSDRMKAILQKFDKPERDVLISYLKMPDLEEKLDMKATMRCFEEMKKALPETAVISYDRAYKKMYKIVKNSDKNQILDIIKKERPAVQEFVLACYKNKKRKIPAHVATVVSKYLEENVS